MSLCSTKGCAFTPLGRRKRCQACLARAATTAATKARAERSRKARVTAELPRARVGAPRKSAAVPRVSLLVADHRPELVMRRRGDCARLRGCEMAWIEAHGGEQAACPLGCAGFAKRAAA